MCQRIGDFETICVGLAIRNRVVVGDADEDDFPFELLSQLVEVGLFPLTLWSPGFPEVDHHRRATMFGERERAAVKGLYLEVDGGVGAGR
jgi:hypothetical protein